jgi:hypothetical protein
MSLSDVLGDEDDPLMNLVIDASGIMKGGRLLDLSG